MALPHGGHLGRGRTEGRCGSGVSDGRATGDARRRCLGRLDRPGDRVGSQRRRRLRDGKRRPRAEAAAAPALRPLLHHRRLHQRHAPIAPAAPGTARRIPT